MLPVRPVHAKVKNISNLRTERPDFYADMLTCNEPLHLRAINYLKRSLQWTVILKLKTHVVVVIVTAIVTINTFPGYLPSRSL